MRLVLLVTSLLAVSTGCTDQKCSTDVDCDDGLFCNGSSSCLLGRCTQATLPNCDDGIACTIDRCREDYRSCNHDTPDVDHDGFGDRRCLDMGGVALGIDCDDNDANRFPGNAEVCDTHDEDCDVSTVGGRDNDHDGFVDTACRNPLPDGGTSQGTDCDDTNEGVHAGQLERCNGADDNCNGQVDEGVRVTRFTDADHDGWGVGAGSLQCADTPDTAGVAGDCDDANPAMNPGQVRCQLPPSGKVDLCTADAGFTSTVCPAAGVCHPQPNGLGVCL